VQNNSLISIIIASDIILILILNKETKSNITHDYVNNYLFILFYFCV
jgi:hypothetical protein